MISYEPLLKKMKEKGLTTYVIRRDKIISQSALTAIMHGENITISTLDRLCAALDCQPGELLKYEPDKPE